MIKIKPQFNGKFKSIKNFFPKKSQTVGIGVTAFPRAGIGYLLPNYKILSIIETVDLDSIRQLCPVISLEKTLKTTPPEKFSTSSLLSQPQSLDYLNGLKKDGKVNLAVYKASTTVDALVLEKGFNLLSTPGRIRKEYEHKKYFRTEAEKAGLKLIPGRSMRVEKLLKLAVFDKMRQEYGEKLVFQLTGYSIGGGRGTFFINGKKDWLNFKEFIESTGQRIVKYTGVNVTRFIKGKETSVACCATRYDTLVGVLQTQIMSQPEVSPFISRNGVWNGHDWHLNFSSQAQTEAEKIAKTWGNYIYKQGYKGIFGLDLLVEEKTDKVWPVECNSRYTGAFPIYTMMQLNSGELPLDVYHFLEWFGVKYEIDPVKTQQLLRQPKKGAHLVICNMERRFVLVAGKVKGGVYKTFKDNKGELRIKWLRPGFSLLDLKSSDEFILADRAPEQYMILKPAERIGRLIFKKQIINEKGEILPETKEIIQLIYNLFELTPIQKPKGF